MIQQDFQSISIDEVMHALGTSPQGLRSQEALARIALYGENTFKKEKISAPKIFFKQFQSSLIYLLLIAAGLSFSLHDFSDGVVITTILLINTLLGFFQEYKSEKAVEKLSKLINREVLVKRDGKNVLIDEKFLVPGDLVLMRQGDIVPADLRLIKVTNLLVNESQLTGESQPINKSSAADGGRATMLFAGSVVEKGDGVGVVIQTGNKTELGKIADLSQSTKKLTQYEKSLQAFSNYLVRVTLFTLLFIFIAKLLITGDVTHLSSLFLFIVALAIAVIPEALPVITTVTLAQGALRLAQRHVIVKRLSSLEDLGNITLLCTDKTGTLTENKMTIQEVVAAEPELLQKLAFAAREMLDAKRQRSRNSYDGAFAAFMSPHLQNQADEEYVQLDELPFDPEARRRRVILQDKKTKKCYLVEAGSLEILLHLSAHPQKKEYLDQISVDGKQGIRHFAVAWKEVVYDKNFNILEHETRLNFVGYVKLIDPLRPTAKHTIELAEKLGIAIKILSGDSREVAEFIGTQIGLLKTGDHVYTGEELSTLSMAELHGVAETCPVFAEITPQQKYTLIQILKEKYVVGYQGDGINDAPSLKLADVAIAVNTASDVAKDSADILLLNKDLSVIINGIQYGRAIFVNINKYIKHTLVGNFGNFFALAALYLIAKDLPLLPIQLLLTSLITDIPLVTIYSDTVDVHEVAKPQRYDIASLMFISLFLGMLTTLFEFLFFTMVQLQTTLFTETSLFLFMTCIQLVVIFSVRNKGFFWQGKRPSFLLTASIVTTFLLSLVLSYVQPFTHIFSFTPLAFWWLLVILGLTAFYFVILDTVKVWYYTLVRSRVNFMDIQKDNHA